MTEIQKQDNMILVGRHITKWLVEHSVELHGMGLTDCLPLEVRVGFNRPKTDGRTVIYFELKKKVAKTIPATETQALKTKNMIETVAKWTTTVMLDSEEQLVIPGSGVSDTEWPVRY